MIIYFLCMIQDCEQIKIFLGYLRRKYQITRPKVKAKVR